MNADNIRTFFFILLPQLHLRIEHINTLLLHVFAYGAQRLPKALFVPTDDDLQFPDSLRLLRYELVFCAFWCISWELGTG
jgi:hypothetical protein